MALQGVEGAQVRVREENGIPKGGGRPRVLPCRVWIERRSDVENGIPKGESSGCVTLQSVDKGVRLGLDQPS